MTGPDLLRLRDGSSVAIRVVGAEDEPALRAFLKGLCLEARRLRFFSAAIDLETAARWASATASNRYGLIAEDQAGTLVGHAVFIELDSSRAEVAVEVVDHLHGRGLGTILLERLAVAAEARGITRFVAQVLPENHEMLDVFRDGFDARVSLREGTESIEFPTSTWRLAHERFGADSGAE